MVKYSGKEVFLMKKGAVEIERKFIVKKPSPELIGELPDYSRSEITQIYISSPPGVTHRVRKRVYPDRCEYTETQKIRIDDKSAIEDENEIDCERFNLLSKSIKEGTRPIVKERYTFRCGAQLFELDIYPEWKESCILEAEIPERSCEVQIPSFIKVVREVTGYREYSNAAMSISFPEEEK